jgi:hypothetical protein
MASNNPYHITTPYEVSSQLAGYQKDVQDAELGKLRLEETRRQLDEASLARNIKAEAVKGLTASQEQAIPQAPMPMAPQQTAPQAEPGSTAFWQGQNTAAPAQPEVQTNPVQQWQTAKKDFDVIGKQMQEFTAISKALKDKGLVDQAADYDSKVIGLQSKAEKAKEDFLDHSIKVMGLAGNLANGYLKAVKDNPGNDNAAWAQFAMAAKANGADDDNKLMMIPPAQRQQVAQQIMDQTESGKERARMAIEQMKASAKAERDLKLDTYRKDRMALTERLAAASRDIRKESLAFQEGKFEFTTLDNHMKDQIKDAETRKGSVDKDLNRLQSSLSDLQKGNMFYTASGKAMSSGDPEVLAAEAKALQDAIDSKQEEKTNLDNFINDLNTERYALGRKAPGAKKDAEKPKQFQVGTKYKFVQGASPDDIKVYTEKMSAAKTQEEKLKIQEAAFNYGLVEPK